MKTQEFREELRLSLIQLLHPGLPFARHSSPFINLYHGLAFLLANNLERISHDSALDIHTLFSELDHFLPYPVFYTFDQIDVSLTHESQTLTFPTSTSSATDTMDVIIWIARDIVVYDKLDFWNIETTGCNIGGYEYASCPGSEACQI